MISGEFTIERPGREPLVLPNQFTVVGMQQVLRAAFWQQPQNWYVGLCAKNPGDAVALGDLNEPTIGVNGYARQAVPMDQANWGTLNVINNESYVRSRAVTFPFVVGPYDKQFNRMFITDGTYVIAISAPHPDGLQENDSDFVQTYTLYFR